MAASVVTVDRNLKAGVWPILKGHWVTLKNFFRTPLPAAAPRPIEFPEKKRNVSSRYRGIHVLTEREDGTPKCVACYMCATVCPAECIYIEAGERPEKTIEKYPTRFEIDLLRCVYCGFCVDACPEEAIIMSRENDLVGTTRAELIIDRDRLMARGKLVEHGAGLPPGRPRRAPPRPHRRPRAPEGRARHRARHAADARLARHPRGSPAAQSTRPSIASTTRSVPTASFSRSPSSVRVEVARGRRADPHREIGREPARRRSPGRSGWPIT